MELSKELDLEDGWSDLTSLATSHKGWIHKVVDKHYRLQKLFQKVRASSFPVIASENA